MKRKSLILALALLLSLSPVTRAVEEDGSFGVMIPVFSAAAELEETQMDAISVFASASGTVVFTREDFTSRLTGGDDLLGVIITAMPSSGRLDLDGRPLLPGEAVPIGSIDRLSYIPSGVSPPTVSFQFLPVMNGGIWKTPVSVNMRVREGENRPPVAENIRVTTYRNVPVKGYLRARDPDGDAVVYKIMSKPRRGDITLGEGGEFTYTPFKDKTGKDTVTYVVADSFGNLSPEATISVQIEKSQVKTTYSDMEGHPAAYAAIRLIEEDIFIGEQVCGEFRFDPDALVTRGDFIAMALRAVRAEVRPSAVTGFADDADIPARLKPYAQAALKAGIISGAESPDGRKSFLADRAISLSEAAVILNNAIQIADVHVETAGEAVPVWAAQAATNLDAAGVLPGNLTAGLWSAPLTRADAAQLLTRAINAARDGKGNHGLLSWVFGW
ncbi:MAG: Ig-like domain-containing protein [Oscillospiraceae bacterium]|nr:Ig-like domain-containing protein [Oscillospiraceae bacterium]